MDASKRAEELRALLNHHSNLYYNEDAPTISDQEYDALMRELKMLESSHPELIVPDSPTQKVGGTAKRTAGVLVAHRVPMLSMQDLFTREEVDHFMDDCREKLGEGITFWSRPKLTVSPWHCAMKTENWSRPSPGGMAEISVRMSPPTPKSLTMSPSPSGIPLPIWSCGERSI